MTRYATGYRKRRREHGVALVIVLAFVVLLSGLVVAYFTRTTTDRQISDSSFNQSNADELARSALNIITSTLKQEIADPYANDSITTIGNTTIYTPKRAYIAPMRNTQLGGTVEIPSLIRISTDKAIDAPGVDYRASNASSTAVSANGRSISLARWNKHCIIPRDPANASKYGTDPIPAFTAPSWIYITDQGPAVLTAPSRAVMGRYAYAIYDEGAFLDANVAGYPIPDTGTHAHTGSLACANLTLLGINGVTGVNNLVGWRNYASANPRGNLDGNFTFSEDAVTQYFNAVLSDTTGFLKVRTDLRGQRTDQAFLSRQELIAFAKTTTGGILPYDVLKYLGTFSRCYSPVIASGSAADYAALYSEIEDPPRVVAGKLNLNNADPLVLQAVIDGAITDALPGITTASHKSIVKSLADKLSTSSLEAGEDFVASVHDAIENAPLLSSTTSQCKQSCEDTVLRALFSVRNTRTWNLMIDVVAQTGRFQRHAPPTQQALSVSFVVLGERRYWLHIAIDRITGKVIDQQLEAVFE